MALRLFHHPRSRAASTVWMLEEVGEPYELEFVDIRAGAQREEPHRARNQMTKVPVLQDGDALVSENAAIGLYLADRYAAGVLAPTTDEADRGPFLRWCFFSPSVIEPCCMAHASNWDYSPSAAGFGTYENMVATLEAALERGPYLLGERFSMADVIVGDTLSWMIQFGMMQRGENIGPYVDRLAERPARRRAREINDRIAAERGVG